ncbi:hypothetical protein [Streptomyces himalayensis]|uniref:Uncharacterized protein n=1 Tax=Streptomyces himalayensis subsp. himalayensis TaxID=2756131 RepID=A0A7W0DLF7_9ACTN|nr:hypothetical protein [Streptomyces himalayensis subsp. himalayensis]
MSEPTTDPQRAPEVPGADGVQAYPAYPGYQGYPAAPTYPEAPAAPAAPAYSGAPAHPAGAYAAATAAAATVAPPPMPPLPPEASAPEQSASVQSSPPKDRHVLRAVARWTAAVLVFGAVGTGTAFGITSLERTDVPGLETRHDGRWDYPELSLPALPSGSPRPFSDGNEAEVHHADVRELLLPAPAGATPDKRLDGGWTTVESYVSEYEKDRRKDLEQALTDSALRHIVARGWTMPDGTVSRVYLLRFTSVAYADAFLDYELDVGAVPGQSLAGSPESKLDQEWDSSDSPPSTQYYVYAEPKPYGAKQVRQAYIAAGDTIALVLHEKKGGAPAIPFHQSVILQSQLLA